MTADVEALVVQHLPLVRSVVHRAARRSRYAQRLFDELMSAGVMGLIEAAQRYDDTNAASFITFAEYRIHGAVVDELRRLGPCRRMRAGADPDQPAWNVLFTDDVEAAASPAAIAVPAFQVDDPFVAARIEAALRALPPRLERMVRLYFWQDVQMKAIGAAMFRQRIQDLATSRARAQAAAPAPVPSAGSTRHEQDALRRMRRGHSERPAAPDRPVRRVDRNHRSRGRRRRRTRLLRIVRLEEPGVIPSVWGAFRAWPGGSVSRAIFRRDEFLNASLDLGTAAVDLGDYATTGLRVVTVGPSGVGKTNAGLLVAEQLSAQGWVSILMDPEGELEALYGKETAMRDRDHLESHLRGRHHPLLVVRARDTQDFLDYGRTIMRVIDEERKPVFLMVDEGQIFSTSRRSKKEDLQAQASDLLNDFTERGRKRSLDLFVTCHRFSGTLSRSLLHNKNLTFIGRQEDPTAWSALAPQFKGSGIGYGDLAGLASGEFVMIAKTGMQKVAMPLAQALADVAPKASVVRQVLPTTFTAWDRAMREIPNGRLQALTTPVVNFLGAVAGLTAQQIAAGMRALREEVEARA